MMMLATAETRGAGLCKACMSTPNSKNLLAGEPVEETLDKHKTKTPNDRKRRLGKESE
jgi:hypothetical protein